MEKKIDWQTFGIVALIILCIYMMYIKPIIDPTPCYPGEVIEYNDGRSSATCKTTIEEYDKWARKHMPYDEYLKWHESVKDDLGDYDE